jgi:RNA 2',3'-cyclic 3'-phosphodiesterase
MWTEMPDTLRLFIGIDIGDDWTNRLSATVARLRPDLGTSVRWVRPELYHVTVVFLGNQPAETVASIERAIISAATGVQPFTLSLTDLRRLGGHERGALVASVNDPSGALQLLRSRLDAALVEQDIAIDSKRLVPHVTLGRPRGRGASIPTAAVDFHGAPLLAVAAVNLVKSDLQPTGPVYETIASATLDT